MWWITYLSKSMCLCIYIHCCPSHSTYHWRSDSTYHWRSDSTYHWRSDSTYNWRSDSTYHWRSDPTYHWRSDSTYHWTFAPVHCDEFRENASQIIIPFQCLPLTMNIYKCSTIKNITGYQTTSCSTSMITSVTRNNDSWARLLFNVRLLSVLRGHSFFSSSPQWPMTSDFEGFLSQFLSLTTDSIFITSLVWRGPWTPDFPHLKPALLSLGYRGGNGLDFYSDNIF